ncbi:UDP-N-acetylglucosamine 1-carboxyvinyltransferase [Carboxydothermus pertinax]|uniref:UDP-N-acetylglucosamine 1-carboxyvinyltransferase n=1 Tax=Carboxydothermus pertinax TaxID=870242 RepID=A0A1L8CS76_9THEO|nr:UDP-N-acetylglucosamine 1-carboxyvinyltransferase [Carboxydothermus pertinax]GAV21778.1 UDP-N-acetylglucosamine 1-carboxyvinyltransferase [Carboxydothermus pertinax]
MEKFFIVGSRGLKGEIKVSGAKNSALPILAATLLTREPCILENIPKLEDINIMLSILKKLGSKVEFGQVLAVQNNRINEVFVPEELARRIRASNLLLGPLVARFQEGVVPLPGGCNIGNRPMDLHLKGLKLLGAEVEEKAGFIKARAKKLKGAEIHLDFPSVGATENLMLAATLAQGTTVIRNAAREPEIVDLQNFLNLMGAKVKGAGTDVVKITGVNYLRGVHHKIIPDRIEAGTHMVMAAATQSDIIISGVIPEHLEAIMAKLRETGAAITFGGDWVRVTGKSIIKPVDIKTMPYPGFPTDMQPQIVALLTLAQGTSIISEGVFDNRFKHVEELRRMGADIRLESRIAVIKGVPKLTGASVIAHDLRAAAALVIAGLAAEGMTVLEGIKNLDRGYENLDLKYQLIGAQIKRVNGEEKY